MRKKDLLPPARIPSAGLAEGVQMEPQIETLGLFICSLQVEGVTVFPQFEAQWSDAQLGINAIKLPGNPNRK